MVIEKDKAREREDEVRRRITNSEMVSILTGTFFSAITGMQVYRGNYWFLAVWVVPGVFVLYGLRKKGRLGEYINRDLFIFLYMVCAFPVLIVWFFKNGVWWYGLYLSLVAGSALREMFKEFFDEVRGR